MKFINSIVTMVFILLAFTVVGKDYGLHFDDAGNIIKPDQEYLWRGIKDEKEGFRQSAFKNFKRAAEFGNYHAMSLVGLYLMQDNDYGSAHAWFKLIDLSKIPNRDYIEDIIKNLEIMLSVDELNKAELIKAELTATYGSHPTLLRRAEWKNCLQFTGTHLRGYIPPFLRIELNSGMQVTGRSLIKQVDDFIYEYEFTFGLGEVTLDEIELVEEFESEVQDQN